MSFNSIDFVVFFLLVLAANAVLRRAVVPRNILLLAASYVFYGWWDWRFLSLLMLSTFVDFFVARALHSAKSISLRRFLLGLSIACNLGVLAYFKYANFFLESATEVLSVLGFSGGYTTLSIVLPVGISFYTFQTMSYTIDVYRGDLKPTKSLLNFALYVAFFPQLVAGPIERATTLLPQLAKPTRYQENDLSVGIWLVLLGYFKKVFVADNIGASVDMVFEDSSGQPLLSIVVAVIGFSLQIYGDFSGYSDIARGIARLLGFRLRINFRLPYFAISPSDFWQRWHISLSSWLRDYLYIPLGGNRGGPWKTNRNLILTMLLGGLWHGASMHFVIWGLYHGVLLVTYRALGNRRDSDGQSIVGYPSWLARWALMFVFTQIGWFIFRCPSVVIGQEMLTSIDGIFSSDSLRLAAKVGFYGLPLIALDTWMQRTGNLLAPLRLGLFAQTLLYASMMIAIATLGFVGISDFIYFQF